MSMTSDFDLDFGGGTPLLSVSLGNVFVDGPWTCERDANYEKLLFCVQNLQLQQRMDVLLRFT